RPFLLGDTALDHGDVGALDVACLELRLETALGALGLCEDEQPGCLTVQSVDDEEAAPRQLGVHVVEEQAVDVRFALAGGGDGEKAGRLVDHEEIVVLVDQTERGWERHGAMPPERDADGRIDGNPAVPDGSPVDFHAAVLEPLLQARAGRLGELRSETLEEGHDIPETNLQTSYMRICFLRSSLMRSAE